MVCEIFLRRNHMKSLTQVLSILVLSFTLLGCASVRNEIIIEAKPDEVWSVLMDIESYPKWNQVIIDPNGKFEERETIVFQFREASGKQYEVKAKVIKVEPNRLLNQYGGFWGIMTYDHRYILEPVPEGTKVTIAEEYKGAYVPFWDNSNMEASYEILNRALKMRVLELKAK